jgi:hypothetical protein
MAQISNYSQNLYDYAILLDELSKDSLCCTLSINSNMWMALIKYHDLKSQMIDLKRLKIIIKLNSNQIMPNYIICLELIKPTILILTITYNCDFVEWTEQITFQQQTLICNTLQNEINQKI